MKAERRHQLQTNALAHSIAGLGDRFRQYGGKVFLALVIILLVVFLIRLRARNAADNRRLALEAVQTARQEIEALETVYFQMGESDTIHKRVRDLVDDAKDKLEQINGQTDDRAILAEAQVARGDLFWHVANLPPSFAAANAGYDRESALKEAEEAYQSVLNELTDQPLAATTARFGLAAIAQNRGDFDAARKQYQSIIDAP
jgi:hypothetical protein